MGFFHFSAAFAMIARRASGDYVRPYVRSAEVARNYMINGQSAFTPAAILAGIIVASENLAPRQLDMRARAIDLIFETNNGWARY